MQPNRLISDRKEHGIGNLTGQVRLGVVGHDNHQNTCTEFIKPCGAGYVDIAISSMKK